MNSHSVCLNHLYGFLYFFYSVSVDKLYSANVCD